MPATKTAALLVDHSEIQELDCLKHLSKSKDFRQDLTMNQAMWVYLPHNQGEAARRVLLLQQKNKKPSSSEEESKDESAEDKALEA